MANCTMGEMKPHTDQSGVPAGYVRVESGNIYKVKGNVIQEEKPHESTSQPLAFMEVSTIEKTDEPAAPAIGPIIAIAGAAVGAYLLLR